MIFTRTNEDGPRIVPLCKSQRGGEQGNATTNIFFPLCMNAPLKQTEENFSVLVRAIQDDTTLLGDAQEIFGEDKARAFLHSLVEERGNRIHPGKARAYGNTEEQRSLIPPGVRQPHYSSLDEESGEEIKFYGIEVCGVAMGDKGFVERWLLEKAEDIAE